MNRDRLRPPPSTVTGDLWYWLSELQQKFNQMPTMSYYSGIDPNVSKITGSPGHILVNVGSSSTASRIWVCHTTLSRSTNSWLAR